jgi:hypothetical protein
MPWPITYTIWLYVICIVGTLAAYFYYENKAKKEGNTSQKK